MLGYQPSLAGDLLSDATQPSHFGGNQPFEDMLAKRHAARKALNDADADRRLRRALTLKYKGINAEYALGQQVYGSGVMPDSQISSRSAGLALLRW